MAKKNTTTTTALLALAAAGAAFFIFRPKTAKAAGVITPDDPFPPEDSKPPEADPLPPSTPKKNAPPMGVSVSKAIQIGNPVVDNYATEANEIVIGQMGLGDDWVGPPPEATSAEVAPYRSLYQIPSGQSVASWIADQAYYGTFKALGKNATIPSSSNRGSGWQDYIDVWNAFHSRAKAQLIRGIK